MIFDIGDGNPKKKITPPKKLEIQKSATTGIHIAPKISEKKNNTKFYIFPELNKKWAWKFWFHILFFSYFHVLNEYLEIFWISNI